MSYREEIDSARRAAAGADARHFAHEAGVIPAQIDTFLKLVDLTDGPDENTVRERVRSALRDAPELDARKLQLGNPTPPPRAAGEAHDAAVRAALTGMRSSVGIAAPAESASAPATALDAEVDQLAAAMRHAVGIA